MSHRFRDICENSILTSWTWTKVKGHGTKPKPICGFPYVYNGNEFSIYHLFEIFAKIAFWPPDLGPRSKVMAPNESPYRVSFVLVIEMKSLSLVVYEIFVKIAFDLLTLGQGQRPWHQIMIFFMSTIEINSLALVVFEIFFSKIAFDLLTLDQGQRSWHQKKAHIWFPICLQ